MLLDVGGKSITHGVLSALSCYSSGRNPDQFASPGCYSENLMAFIGNCGNTRLFSGNCPLGADACIDTGPECPKGYHHEGDQCVPDDSSNGGGLLGAVIIVATAVGGAIRACIVAGTV